MQQSESVPRLVVAARQREKRLRFPMSCDDGVGRLLQILSGAVPASARILELGTGVGVGLAWIVSGLEGRDDVSVVSVESDVSLFQEVGAENWPEWVDLKSGDGAEFVEHERGFQLIFADAPGGKLINLSGTIAALSPGGLLVLDDMDLSRHDDDELREQLARAWEAVLGDPRLVTVELDVFSGVLLSRARPVEAG